MKIILLALGFMPMVSFAQVLLVSVPVECKLGIGRAYICSYLDPRNGKRMSRPFEGDDYVTILTEVVVKESKEWTLVFNPNNGKIEFVKTETVMTPCFITPKKCDLNSFCNDLQRNSPVKPEDVSIKEERRGGAVSSAHFEISGVPNQKMAEDIIKNAEFYYTNLQKAWFGDRMPKDPAKINLAVIIDENSHEAFTLPKDDPKRYYHRITMRVSKKFALGTTLAHETSHALIAIYFPDNSIPRWANEGVASYNDGEELNGKRRVMMANFAKSNQWPDLFWVASQEGLSSSESKFYAMSYYLVQFLNEKESSDVFFSFSQDLEKVINKNVGRDVDVVVRAHYPQFKSFAELEAQFHIWVKKVTLGK